MFAAWSRQTGKHLFDRSKHVLRRNGQNAFRIAELLALVSGTRLTCEAFVHDFIRSFCPRPPMIAIRGSEYDHAWCLYRRRDMSDAGVISYEQSRFGTERRELGQTQICHL